MLKSRKAVVEHSIGYVQVAVVELCTAQIIVEQFQIGTALLLTHEPLVETVAIVQQVICGHYGYEQQNKQDDGDGLVSLRLLHGGAVFAQSIVGRHLLEQLGVYLIVIAVELPLVERQSGHSTLVTNIENNVVVGLQAIVKPFNLWWHEREISQLAHKVFSVRFLLNIVLVKIIAAQVGKLERLLVFAIDIAEVGAIGVDAGHAKGIDFIRLCLNGRERAAEGEQENDGAGDALWQAEEEF